MTSLVLTAMATTLLMTVALGLTAALRRRSAAVRHRVLAIAFATAALIPVLQALAPEWVIAGPALPWSMSAPAVPTALASLTVVGSDGVRAGDLQPAEGRAAARGPGWSMVVTVVWLAGGVLFLSRLAVGYWRVTRTLAPVALESSWARGLAAAANEVGLRRRVRVALAGSGDTFATVGIRSPFVLVPCYAEQWPDGRAALVMRHELIHVRRLDWAAQMIAHVLCAVHWLNPLLWVALARLSYEAERACDDEVLALGTTPPDYADHLIEVAKRHSAAWPAGAVCMARPSTLYRRIQAMTDTKLDRRQPTRALSAVTTVGLVALTTLLVGLRLGAQGNALSVEGTVFDPSGGALPGATVALVDGNKVSWPATTDREGRFKFEPVGAGEYVLEASVPGFKSLRHTFTLSATRGRTHDITLQVGSLQETIRVVAKRPKPAAAPAAPQGPVRIGGNIKAPRKVLDVRPVYPPSMQAAGREGIVPMEALIGTDGSVTSVRVSSAQVEPEFAAAAVAAVKQWRFTPTLLNGTAVEVQMSVSISFGLED